MEALGLSIADWAIIAITVFAGLMGFSVGLIHGILFIASWGAAAALAWQLRPVVQPYLMNYVAGEDIAYFAALLGVFVVALIVFTLVAGQIGKVVRKSVVGGVDKVLGFGFGVLCGAAVLSIAYIGFIYVYKQGPLLDAIQQARTFPLLLRGANTVEPYLPEQIRRRPKDSGAPVVPAQAPK